MLILANFNYLPRPHSQRGIEDCLSLTPAERKRALQALDIAGETLRTGQDADTTLTIKGLDLAASTRQVRAARARAYRQLPTTSVNAPASPQSARSAPEIRPVTQEHLQRALEAALQEAAIEAAAGSEVSILRNDDDNRDLAPGTGPSLNDLLSRTYGWAQHLAGNRESVDLNDATAQYWVQMLREDRESYNYLLYNCLNAMNRLNPESMRSDLRHAKARDGRAIGTLLFFRNLKNDIESDLKDPGHIILKDIKAARNGSTFHANHGKLCYYATKALKYAREHDDKPLHTNAHSVVDAGMGGAEDVETDDWCERHEPIPQVQAAFDHAGRALVKAGEANSDREVDRSANGADSELVYDEALTDRHYEAVAQRVREVRQNAFAYLRENLGRLADAFAGHAPPILEPQVLVYSTTFQASPAASDDDDSSYSYSSSSDDDDASVVDPFEENTSDDEVEPAPTEAQTTEETTEARAEANEKVESYWEDFIDGRIGAGD